MSREIKFRAWFPAGHWFHQGMLSNWQDTIGTEYLGFQPDDEGVHIMQITGLQDTNGVDIYEGDVLRVDTVDDSFLLEVKWMGGHGCGFSGVRDNGDTYSIAFGGSMVKGRYVVGNIHENPELLEAIE